MVNGKENSGIVREAKCQEILQTGSNFDSTSTTGEDIRTNASP